MTASVQSIMPVTAFTPASISEGTAKNNVSKILRKLGLRDRTQLAPYAARHWTGAAALRGAKACLGVHHDLDGLLVVRGDFKSRCRFVEAEAMRDELLGLDKSLRYREKGSFDPIREIVTSVH